MVTCAEPLIGAQDSSGIGRCRSLNTRKLDPIAVTGARLSFCTFRKPS